MPTFNVTVKQTRSYKHTIPIEADNAEAARRQAGKLAQYLGFGTDSGSFVSPECINHDLEVVSVKVQQP